MKPLTGAHGGEVAGGVLKWAKNFMRPDGTIKTIEADTRADLQRALHKNLLPVNTMVINVRWSCTMIDTNADQLMPRSSTWHRSDGDPRTHLTAEILAGGQHKTVYLTPQDRPDPLGPDGVAVLPEEKAEDDKGEK